MEKISQLMDGELEGHDCRLQVRLLEQDAGLVERWDTYHLIRDVLRGEASASRDLALRVRERLGREPTVIAPHTRLSARVARYTLPMAAAIAGVTVVGWLALNFRPAIESTGLIAAQTPAAAVAVADKPAPVPVGKANAQMNEYVFAHQEFSPTAAMQGVASYVRSVSDRDSDNAR
jgi:sigma-E factor negative regulatory protein RseA